MCNGCIWIGAAHDENCTIPIWLRELVGEDASRFPPKKTR
jgi:hypothetical protein